MREYLLRGYLFNLFRGVVNSIAKRQYAVALSTIENKYMASTHSRKEVVLLKILCLGMGLAYRVKRIDCEIQIATFLSKDPTYHSKRKHIEVLYHFVRDMVEGKVVHFK